MTRGWCKVRLVREILRCSSAVSCDRRPPILCLGRDVLSSKSGNSERTFRRTEVAGALGGISTELVERLCSLALESPSDHLHHPTIVKCTSEPGALRACPSVPQITRVTSSVEDRFRWRNG